MGDAPDTSVATLIDGVGYFDVRFRGDDKTGFGLTFDKQEMPRFSPPAGERLPTFMFLSIPCLPLCSR